MAKKKGKKKKAPRKRAQPKPGALTAKQDRYVDEYMIDLNAGAAAGRAGLSPNYARDLMRNPKIISAIKARKEQRAERVQVHADEVLKELLISLKSSVTDYVLDENGNIAVRKGLPPELIRAVRSIKQTRLTSDGETEVDRVEFQLWDKPKMIALAMRHLDLLNEKPDVNISGSAVQIYLPDNGRSRD